MKPLNEGLDELARAHAPAITIGCLMGSNGKPHVASAF